MSLFPSTLTGRILDDGVTEPPVIELQGISAGQLATVLTAYTPQTEHTAHTAAIGVNAAAIAALQGQVAALPASPDLTPYALAADLAALEGSILANASGLVAVNTSLTQGLAGKANQSALDALQVEVNGKSTPASVDLKLANHPTTAAMNSSITSANNSALATVAATYALKSVVDQLALDVAARQTAADVDQRVATALLPMASTSDLNAAVALRTTPTDVSQLIATALLPFVQQTALDAALALRDGRLDAAEALIAALQAAGYQTSGDIATALLGYVTQGAYDAGQALQDSRLDAADAAILALQNAGPYATSGDLTSLQVSLQSAIDGLLAEIATLGGATNLVNAPAWQGEITFDLLAGTNQVRNLHAVAPLSIQLANDNWTLSFSVDSYSTAQTDALLLPKASEAWVTTQLGGYYTIQGTDDAITAALTNHFTRAEATANLVAGITECKDYTDTSLLDYSDTAQMNQAIADALVPFGTIVQRDAAIAAALAAYYTSAQTDSAIAAGLATIDLSPYWTIAQVQAAITAALVPVTLSNGQSWTGGPTFNLLRGSNVLRNLSVAGALTATFQNLDDTILIESDSYARSETYTQLETGAAITAALDALNLSQYRTEAQVLALIAGELVPYWDQSEVSSFVAGELSNYATNSSVSSSISSALSSYDSSSQVDNKIITALLDFYTRAETDQAIADAVSGGTDLSAYYTSAQTDQEIADAIAGLVGVYVRWTELQAPIINEINIALLDYDTSAQVDAKISGAGFLDQTAGDARYFVRAPGAESGQIWNLVQEQFTPRIVRNLLLEAPLVGDAILGNQSTLRIRSDSWSKAEADSRFLRTNDLGPLDARYFPVAPGAEGSGIYNLIQTQFTPKIIRNLLRQTPLSAQPILGNGSTLQISCDCWSKGQSDARYPLIANFNSLGQRVTDLENSPGVDPAADLTVNSLTATSFVDTPQLQSAAGDLQIQNALVTVRREDGALLASFADGGISLDRDVTVAAASTLNATTADFAQLLVGSTAASGTFNSSSSVTANLEVVSNLRVEAPLVRCDPAAAELTIQGGTNGVLVDNGLRVNGALAPEASLPFLTLSGGSSGVQVLSPLLEQIAVGASGETVGMVIRNASPTGAASLLLDSNNQNGVAELVVLSGGGVQINSFQQFISFNNTSGLANMAIEPNIGGSNDGEVIFGYGFVNLSDRALKENVRAIPEEELQQTFDAVEPQLFDRIDGGKEQIGFVAQDVQASGKLGATMCKTKSLDGRELMALDYQKLSVVLWGIVKKLQKRVEKLEKKKGRKDDSE